MKNAVFWHVTSCGSCKNRRFGGRIASVIRVERISELRTALAVISNCFSSRKTAFFMVFILCSKVTVAVCFHKWQIPLPGCCVSVETQQIKGLLRGLASPPPLVGERTPFQTHKWSHNLRKIGHAFRRGPRPEPNVVAKTVEKSMGIWFRVTCTPSLFMLFASRAGTSMTMRIFTVPLGVHYTVLSGTQFSFSYPPPRCPRRPLHFSEHILSSLI
jgi:hypothetical protein